MPVSQDFTTVDATLIKIADDRQRKDLGNIIELADSIARLGLLHPVIITRDLTLVAGERRLTAWLHNLKTGVTDARVPVQFVDELNPEELQAIELEENVKRKDISWQEQVGAVNRLHKLYSAQNPQWSAKATAERIGYSSQRMSELLKVSDAIEKGDQRVAKAPHARAALNVIRRQDERTLDNMVNEVSSLLDTPTLNLDGAQLFGGDPNEVVIKPAVPASDILVADFNEWASTYDGPKFNFIHMDFPYGIDYDGWDGSAAQWGGYADSKDVYWQLCATLAKNLDRIALPSCHFMFWYSMHFHQDTLDFFAEHMPSVKFNPFPLVWHKTDNKGTLPDPERGPRRVYETCLFGARGDRKIIKAVGNAYGAPTGRADSIHISEKPVPVLKHFMQMVVDNETLMLDPTCGSGSALRAAEDMGAKRVFGLERDEGYAIAARKSLDSSRILGNL